MSNIAGQLSIASNDEASPLLITLATNKRFPNVEQSCDSGYTGTQIAAGTVYGDTQEEADAAAEALLECVPDVWQDPYVTAGSVFELNTLSDGRMIAAGSFLDIGGEDVIYISVMSHDGVVDPSLDMFFVGSQYVANICIQTDGKILFGGLFTSVDGETRNYIARLNTDLTLDATYAPACNNFVSVLKTLSDGRIMVSGAFTSIGGQSRTALAILNADGTVDTSFNPSGISLTLVRDIYELPDGKFLICGSFTYGSPVKRGVARLSATGALDATFAAAGDYFGDCRCILPSGDDFIIGGVFDTSTSGRVGLIKIDADGAVVAGFTTDVNGTGGAAAGVGVKRLHRLSDNSILVGGGFTTIGGESRVAVAKINDAGAVQAFDLGLVDRGSYLDQVFTSVENPTGKIVIGGDFETTLGDNYRRCITRCDLDGTPDA